MTVLHARARTLGSIARHWTQPHRRPGRPPIATGVRRLAVRMARENPTWGYRRVHDELVALGHHLGASTVWQILHDAGIDPAPARTLVTWEEDQSARSGPVHTELQQILTVMQRLGQAV